MGSEVSGFFLPPFYQCQRITCCGFSSVSVLFGWQLAKTAKVAAEKVSQQAKAVGKTDAYEVVSQVCGERETERDETDERAF